MLTAGYEWEGRSSGTKRKACMALLLAGSPALQCLPRQLSILSPPAPRAQGAF